MKSFVLAVPGTGKKEKTRLVRKTDYRYIIKRYGVVILLALSAIPGLAFGAVCAGNADDQMIKSLDFLFITNFKARTEQSLLLTFASSLSSYFVFFFLQFIMGFSAWGFAVMPLTTFLKGFGTGLCAGYLAITYGFKGVGFYMLIMLPGAVLSLIFMLIEGKEAFYLSKSIFKSLFKERYENNNGNYVSRYLVSSANILILVAVSAAVDVFTTLCFSHFYSF